MLNFGVSNAQSFDYFKILKRYWNYRYHTVGDAINTSQHMPVVTSGQEAYLEPRGKMDTKLLQKIEELNLYVLQLEKENKRQDELIEELLKKTK